MRAALKQADLNRPDRKSGTATRRRQIQDLKAKLSKVRAREEAIKREWVEGFVEGGLGPQDWREMTEAIRTERLRLERQLALLKRKSPRRSARPTLTEADRASYLDLLESLLSEDVPDDADRRVARAALVQALVSQVVLEDIDGGYRLHVYGWLTPDSGGDGSGGIDQAPALHDEDLLPQPALQQLDRFRKGRTGQGSAHRGGRGRRPSARAADERTKEAGDDRPDQEDSSLHCVKQGKACLTQWQAREMATKLMHDEYLGADYDFAYAGGEQPPQLAHPRAQPASQLAGLPASELEVELPRQATEDPLCPGGDRMTGLLPLRELAARDLSADALKAAAALGRLRAQKRGGVWHSSRAWVEEYRRSRRHGKPRSPAGRPDGLQPLRNLATAELSATGLYRAARRGRLRAERIEGKWWSRPEWVDEYRSSRWRLRRRR